MTDLLYLSDTYKFESTAKVVELGTDPKGNYIILNQTIFYPQSGGQPADCGTIEFNGQILNVHFVAFSYDRVHHYIKEELNNELRDQDVFLKLDQQRRLLNAKSHTAGHLLAAVVESLAKELIGTKGHHFPDGPYVEFSGKLTSFTSDEFTKKCNEIMQDKITNQCSISVSENEPEDAMITKKNRFVQIESFLGVPCGGTHLSNLNQLQSVSIRKFQTPKGNTKISYTFL